MKFEIANGTTEMRIYLQLTDGLSFNPILFFRYLYSPNIIGFAAARFDEDSYSHHSDSTIGVHVIDRLDVIHL